MNPELEDLNNPEYPHWPGDWPGRRFINLDCIGDPGDWLGLELPSEEEVLTQHPDEDRATAEPLADAYIQKGRELGFLLPTDHGVSEETMHKIAVSDFVGFIREWRRRAVTAGCISADIIAKQKYVSTWALLRKLGFIDDPHIMSDVMPGRSCNFGNVKLSASCVMGRNFGQVVLFTGVLNTKRTISEISFEMPRHIESREQGVAWLVWGLDQAADDHIFKPATTVAWLEKGRKNRNSLPWERERATYAVRPQCSVPREWARITFKTLAEQLAKVEDDAPVVFHFDGEVLTIRCAGKVIAVPAEGKKWSQPYSILRGSLHNLPKRLMQSHIEVSIWESLLRIGRRGYRGAVIVDEGRNQPPVAQPGMVRKPPSGVQEGDGRPAQKPTNDPGGCLATGGATQPGLVPTPLAVKPPRACGDLAGLTDLELDALLDEAEANATDTPTSTLGVTGTSDVDKGLDDIFGDCAYTGFDPEI